MRRRSASSLMMLEDMLREQELELLNCASLNPFDENELRLQYRSACSLPGGFLLGLRSAEGQWLSLIGGWRQGDVTVLHWQMNAAGQRGFRLARRCARIFWSTRCSVERRKLIYYGGRRTPWETRLRAKSVTDLMVRRRSLRASDSPRRGAGAGIVAVVCEDQQPVGADHRKRQAGMASCARERVLQGRAAAGRTLSAECLDYECVNEGQALGICTQAVR